MIIPLADTLSPLGLTRRRASGPRFTNFWKLGESTGAQRGDSVGSSPLTDVGSVSQVTGKVGFGAGFSGSNHLAHVDSAELSMGVGVKFAGCAWVYVTGSSTQITLTKGDFGFVNTYEYGVFARHNGVGNQCLFGICDGNNQDFVAAGVLSLSTWHLLTWWFDLINLYLSVDGAAPASTAANRSARDSTGEFRLGRNSADNFGLVGSLDAVGQLKGDVWSQAERDQLWNGGNGYEP